MAELIILILIFHIVIFCLFKIGDAFSPWMVTVGIWLAIILMSQNEQGLLYPLGPQFYTCVGIWVPIMSLSGILTYYAFPENGNKNVLRDNKITINNTFFNLFLFIAIICTPVYVYQVFKVVMMFGTDNLFNNIRVLATSGQNEGNELLKYINTVNQALYIIAIWKYPDIKRWQFIVIIMANIMCAVAIMEKGFLFFMFFVTLFVLYEKGKIKIRSIAIAAIVIVCLFYYINMLRAAEGEMNNVTFMDFFAIYILSPAVAFEKVQQNLTDQFGTHSFAFFYAVLNKLGIGHFYVEKKLQEFVFVPLPTNVFTIFQPFFRDFGYKGIAFFASVYGIFTGWLYRQCMNGGFISRCLYAYIVEILILQFFQENLLISLSILFQYLFVMYFTLQQKIKINIYKN